MPILDWIKVSILLAILVVRKLSVVSLSGPRRFLLRLFDLFAPTCLDFEHSAFGELFQVLEERVREGDHILQELLRVFCWDVHLEGKERDSDDVVPEDERAQNVCVLAIFL